MENQKFCRYCGKKIPKKGNKMYYCSDWFRQHWHYEVQDELFYTPGVKRDKCSVCDKHLIARQLKYCSKVCYGKGRYKRDSVITADMVKSIKKIQK